MSYAPPSSSAAFLASATTPSPFESLASSMRAKQQEQQTFPPTRSKSSAGERRHQQATQAVTPVERAQERAQDRLEAESPAELCRAMNVSPELCQQTDPGEIIKQSVLFGWAANSTGACTVSPVVRTAEQSKVACWHKFNAIQSVIERLHAGEDVGGTALQAGGFGAPQIVPLYPASSEEEKEATSTTADAVVVKYMSQEKNFKKAVAGLQLISDRKLWADPMFAWHFINVYDYFPRRLNSTSNGLSKVQYLIVMEKMDGSAIDFVRRFRDDPRMMHTSLQRMALQLLDGLFALNMSGLAHTDIKPDNVTYLLNEAGEAFFKFIDLDCVTDAQSFNGCRTAIYLDVHQPGEINAFRSGGGRISNAVLSEQEEERVRRALIAADLYKLGLTLLEMGLGYHPFGQSSLTADESGACPGDNMCMNEMQFIMKMAMSPQELVATLKQAVDKLRSIGVYGDAFVDLVELLVTQPPGERFKGLTPKQERLRQQQQELEQRQ